MMTTREPTGVPFIPSGLFSPIFCYFPQKLLTTPKPYDRLRVVHKKGRIFLVMNARNVLMRTQRNFKNVTLHVLRGREQMTDRFVLTVTDFGVTTVLHIREYADVVRVIIEACFTVEQNRWTDAERKAYAQDKIASFVQPALFAESLVQLIEVMKEVESN